MAIGHHTKGFTLIELVMTIVITAIVFSIAGIYVVAPMRNLSDVARRAELVNAAEMALQRMARDIHKSLPNSIRVKQSGNLVALEIINVIEGMRYRRELPGGTDDLLNFGTSDTSFNVLGQFVTSTLGTGSYRIVIYNTGAQGVDSDDPTAGANAYATASAPGPELPVGAHVITPSSTTVTLSNPGAEGRVAFSSGHQFSLESPTQRMFVVDTPVSYICDPDNGTVTRYDTYAITSVQPTDSSLVPLNVASSALLTNRVSACSFTYQPGTSQRNSVVTLDLILSNGDSTVQLLHQVSVSNAP